ncbi:MAG: hypothetical protein ACO3JL_13440 [Myxococcota bacterium]
MTESESTIVKSLLNLGEERLSEVLGQLLANERFMRAMQGAVTQGLEAKRNVDRSVTWLLDLAHVPTLEEVQQLRERLQEVEDMLANILDRVQQLDAHLPEARSQAEASSANEPTSSRRPSRRKNPS